MQSIFIKTFNSNNIWEIFLHILYLTALIYDANKTHNLATPLLHRTKQKLRQLNRDSREPRIGGATRLSQNKTRLTH